MASNDWQHDSHLIEIKNSTVDLSLGNEQFLGVF
jgi:hypothetical protein